MTEQDRAAAAFERLVRIMDRLRSPGGCPWDAEQTHASLVRYLIEESYEVVEAIEAPAGVDTALLKEELGDVLLQVVFHARVAEERAAEDGGFGVADVVEALNEKLVRRHPHVFAAEAGDAPGEASAQDAPDDLEALTRNWDAVKRAEKPERRGPFDGIPPHLPALARAEKALSKGAKAGLPLPKPAEVPTVSGRDVGVSPESVRPGQADEGAERAVGEALLGLVSAARGLGVDPERALRRAVAEYVRAAEGGASSPEERSSPEGPSAG